MVSFSIYYICLVMAKQGRKPILSIEKLREGPIKLTVKQAAFGYQYTYSLRKRYPGEAFVFNNETREIHLIV